MNEYGVKFQYIRRQADGVPYRAVIGLGSDGTLWVEPDEFGVEPGDVEKMMKFPGTSPLVLYVGRRVFVNARAVAETVAAPEVRAKMREGIDVIVKEMQGGRCKNEHVRNN